MAIQIEVNDGIKRIFSDAGLMIEDERGRLYRECVSPEETDIEFTESDTPVPEDVISTDEKLNMLLEALQIQGALSRDTIQSINQTSKLTK